MATLLAVAGADGLSAEEEGWVRDRAAVLSLPAQSLDSLVNGDGMPVLTDVGASSSSTSDGEGSGGGRGGAVAKAMLFDSLLLAAQDGLSSAEADRSVKVAASLGLSETAVAEVGFVHTHTSDTRDMNLGHRLSPLPRLPSPLLSHLLSHAFSQVREIVAEETRLQEQKRKLFGAPADPTAA